MTETPSSIVFSNKVLRPVVRWMAITSLACTQAGAFTPFVQVPSSFQRDQRTTSGSKCKGVSVTVSGVSLPCVNQHHLARTCNYRCKHTRLFSQSNSKGYLKDTRLSSSVSGTYNFYSDEPSIAASVPSSLYSADINDSRYSASDWFHNIMTLPKSSILKEIKGPVIAVTIWSTFISIMHLFLRHRNMTQAAKALTISSKPHALLVSALGLLLVFRTNSAYQRFAVSSQFSRAQG